MRRESVDRPGALVSTPEANPRARQLWTVDVLRGGVEQIDRIVPDWTDLRGRSAEDPPYARPEWIRAFVAHHVPEGKLRLVTVRRDGRLEAVLPLYARRTRICGLPVRQLRGTGDIGRWRYDMLCAAGETGQAALAALAGALRRIGGWDMIELCDVPEGGAGRALVAAAAAAGHPVGQVEMMRSPYVKLAGWDGSDEYFLKQGSANFRRSVRRALKRAHGKLRLERFARMDPDRFERFLALEAAGWKGEAGTAIASTPRATAYFRAQAAAIESAGEFVVQFLWCGDDLIATQGAVVHGGCYSILKGAHNEEFKNLAPGHLISHLVILDSAKRGLERYDFVGDDEDWKQSWTPHVLAHDHCYVFRRGVYGRLLERLKFRAAPWLKRKLRRGGPE